IIGRGVKPPRYEKDQYKNDVDDGNSGAKKIVVIACDKLAYLVNEGSEAYPAKYRRRALGPSTDKGEKKAERGQHKKPAPEHVRDVQTASAELRIARQFEKEPDDENGSNGCHQKILYIFPRIEIAD
ncbi:MAG: hypothetical protein ICV86_16125, partial [Microcoleus sp. T3-bin5]|nr:hypothetical protein [Microcoleus sp. T3-bin5]